MRRRGSKDRKSTKSTSRPSSKPRAPGITPAQAFRNLLKIRAPMAPDESPEPSILDTELYKALPPDILQAAAARWQKKAAALSDDDPERARLLEAAKAAQEVLDLVLGRVASERVGSLLH